MTNHDTIPQDAARTTQQTQHATRAGSHRNRNGGSLSARREVPDIVFDVLASPGHPIEESVRQEMEAKLGADFSDVRVHTGPKATAATSSVHARAFTYGKHIVFNRGEYRPETTAGKRLLVHELVHVVQQTGDDSRGLSTHQSPNEITLAGKSTVPSVIPGRDAEREAQRIARRIFGGDDSNYRVLTRHERRTDVTARLNEPVGHSNQFHRIVGESKPAVRVCVCVQRKPSPEIPQDTLQPPSGKSLPDSSAHWLYSGEGYWKLVLPASLKKQVEDAEKSTPSIADRLNFEEKGYELKTVSHSKNKRKEQKQTMKEYMTQYNFPKNHKSDTNANLGVRDKKKEILSGNPGGTKLREGKRFIRGPVESHLCAAARALHPKYNQNVMNVWFQSHHLSLARWASRNTRKLASLKVTHQPGPTPGGQGGKPVTKTTDLKTAGSVSGWEHVISAAAEPVKDDTDYLPHIIMMLDNDTSPSKEDLNNLDISQKGAMRKEVKDLNIKMKLEKPQTPSKLECASYLAYCLKNGGYELDDDQLPKKPFVEKYLSDAIRALRQETLSVDKSTVETIIQNSTGSFKIHFLNVTLNEMAAEFARAVHEMCQVVLQYMHENSKKFTEVDFSDQDITGTFDDIGAEKAMFLREYYTIIQCIDSAEKKKIKAMKNNFGSAWSTWGAAASATAGVATGGMSVLAQAGAAAGVALTTATFKSATQSVLDDADGAVDPEKIIKEWRNKYETSGDNKVSKELKNKMGIDESSSEKKKSAVSDLTTEIKKELDDHVVDFT